ncbi:MAG TPA: fimbria/pilus periplasmic chaperone [Usitatibacter sp.]|nr:fimbria/pilus periplasmic chaperone [Usitatibacter sp.]
MSPRRTPTSRTHRFLPLAVIFAAMAMPVLPVAAGQFSVSPVRIYMGPRDRATAITITNEGNDELVMQADIFTWKQKPGGEDDLVLTEDLFLAPPIIKLAPNSRQVVRLAMLKPSQSGDQLTYRMIVREIAEARPAEKNAEVTIALAFSLPVFITPPTAKGTLDCKAQRTARDTLRVECENGGNAYANPREFVLSTASGERLAVRDSGGYILPGIKRSFEVKRADGPLPAGPARLAVSLDDGSTKTFDVRVAE